MIRTVAGVVCLSVMAGGAFSAVEGQGRPDPAALAESQRAAMTELTFMDGAWRGTAWTLLPSGEHHELLQTERIGSFLGGSVKVIEGRGYESDGSTGFNAFAIISYDPRTQTYSMRSYAQGQVGDFSFTPTPDGYEWEVPAGPMTIRYTAVINGDSWKEVGHRIVPGQEPVQIFEMNLTRLGDTDWPGAAAVPIR